MHWNYVDLFVNIFFFFVMSDNANIWIFRFVIWIDMVSMSIQSLHEWNFYHFINEESIQLDFHTLKHWLINQKCRVGNHKWITHSFDEGRNLFKIIFSFIEIAYFMNLLIMGQG